jgi:hypothetical protein
LASVPQPPPPPAPPEGGARELAQITARRILAGFGFSEHPVEWGPFEYTSVAADVPLADVEADVQSFRNGLLYQRHVTQGVVCRETPSGPPIPIDIFDFWRVVMPSTPFPRHAVEAAGLATMLTSAEEAISFFTARLNDFLTTRFAARESDISRNPGYQIEVHTHHFGERVHYSPAYFQKISTVLGSPTTPVTGWIQPGPYTFSVMKAGGQIAYDIGECPVPPLTVIDLVI